LREGGIGILSMDGKRHWQGCQCHFSDSGGGLIQGAAHGVEGGGAVEPDFEGEAALVEEEGEAVGGAGASAPGVFEEAGDGWAVDHVIDHEVGGDDGGREEARVGALHAEGGGVDDEVGAGELFAEGGVFEGDDGDAVFGAFEAVGGEELRGAAGNVVGFLFGAIDEDEARAFLECALQGGGGTGPAAGAEDHDAKVAEVEGEDFADGADEAGSVGIEAGSAGAVEEEGVDGAELTGGVVEFRAEFEGLELVGDGEVESEEIGAAGEVDGFVEVFRRAFDFGVADAGAEGFEGRVVHGGGEGVLDGGAEDGEADFGGDGAAAFGAGAEVFEGEGGLLEVDHVANLC